MSSWTLTIVGLAGALVGFFMTLFGASVDPRYQPERPGLAPFGIIIMVVFGLIAGGALDRLLP